MQMKYYLSRHISRIVHSLAKLAWIQIKKTMFLCGVELKSRDVEFDKIINNLHTLWQDLFWQKSKLLITRESTLFQLGRDNFYHHKSISCDKA